MSPAESPAITPAQSPITKIASVFFRLSHAYHTIMSAVAPMIKIVQKSGIKRKTAYSAAFKIMKLSKNCEVCIIAFFLSNRLERKKI